jgi:hypothetical protein
MTFPNDIFGGCGQIGCGRSVFGNGFSLREPRFEESKPPDGTVGFSVYSHTIHYDAYCFSSRLQKVGLLIELSENGGSTWATAYEDGAFVAPYNGANSRTDLQQGDAQRFRAYIHKTSAWTNDANIQIKTTAQDEFGTEATKETVIEWEPPPVV